jgi:hypothetical protein
MLPLGCPGPSVAWSDAGSLACPTSIADFCAEPGIGAPNTLQESIATENSTGWPPGILVCEPYDYVEVSWTCPSANGVYFAYDKSTGALVGAIEVSADLKAQTCLGGPASLAPLVHCTANYFCLPNDAGLDAGPCIGDASLAELNASDGGV